MKINDETTLAGTYLSFALTFLLLLPPISTRLDQKNSSHFVGVSLSLSSFCF